MTTPLCQTTGRRKRAIARVRVTPGLGHRSRPTAVEFEDYFPSAVQVGR